MPVIPQATGVHARSRRRLSASSLVTWERCRRDWFLTRRLGIRVPTHPEMLLGLIVEEAVIAIWMERAQPVMQRGVTQWVESESEGEMEIDSLDDLEEWLRTLRRPIVDEILSRLHTAWDQAIWKADREVTDVKREKLNAMVKYAIRLQMAEARDCLAANGGPHLAAFRRGGDPFGTPAPFWEGETHWQEPGEPCTWWEAWEIARPWAKDPRILTAQRLFHPDGWAAGELDVAHRWRGRIHIVDIKANSGTGRDHSGVAHQLRFYQWLWNETRTHPAKPFSRVEEGPVEAIRSWHLADGFVHEAELLTDLEAETERLRSIQAEMTTVGLADLLLDGSEPSTEGGLGCSRCHGLETCDYPRTGVPQTHQLIPDITLAEPGAPFGRIADLPSRVSVKGRVHGHWGPMANHYGDAVRGAAITAGDKTAVIEEMGIDAFPDLHDHKGEYIIRNAAPGQWRGMIRLYLDQDTRIEPITEGAQVDRLGLIPTRANVTGVVISRGVNQGVNAKGRAFSMSTAHIWDGSALCEVVAFGRGRSESFDALRVGERIRLMAAEIGWREGTPQLRIDPRNTRLTVESSPPERDD